MKLPASKLKKRADILLDWQKLIKEWAEEYRDYGDAFISINPNKGPRIGWSGEEV